MYFNGLQYIVKVILLYFTSLMREKPSMHFSQVFKINIEEK